MDRRQVLKGSPWSFDRNLVVLSEYDGDVQLAQADFDWCEFWYERLRTFCYCCGIIGHGERECDVKAAEHSDDQIPTQYGAWLYSDSLGDTSGKISFAEDPALIPANCQDTIALDNDKIFFNSIEIGANGETHMLVQLVKEADRANQVTNSTTVREENVEGGLRKGPLVVSRIKEVGEMSGHDKAHDGKGNSEYIGQRRRYQNQSDPYKIQKLRDFPVSDSRLAEIGSLQNELENCLDQKDLMWRQRSKMHWFREGDRNTKFFHTKASIQYKNNLVKGLRDNAGIWCDKDSDIERIVVDHFSKFFETTNPSTEILDRVTSPVVGLDQDAKVESLFLP
ncbi:hypothetical protein ACH5RR_015785 [Cinchona calisaya]|uniref:CCHC-type domain-containing protein n=1 Tax=Cinchona calisaya TaxID=153742 RepID=A0ABD2ZU62_9GENT